MNKKKSEDVNLSHIVNTKNTTTANIQLQPQIPTITIKINK